jgi:ferrous iron transport protein B
VTQAVFGEERPSFAQVRVSDAAAAHTVVLMGNPNVGKTTLFNALTGDSARVGNYPGITVERRAGQWRLPTGDVELIDVPGAYSLCARSPEEQVALEAVLGHGDNPRPSLALVLVDAGQLTRNLYLALQLVEFQVPIVLVVTMLDEVADRPPLPASIGAIFGVPCVGVHAHRKLGLAELGEVVSQQLGKTRVGDARLNYSGALITDIDRVASALPTRWRRNVEHDRALAAWALLSFDPQDELQAPPDLRARCEEVRADAEKASRDIDLELIGPRYAFLEKHVPSVYEQPAPAEVVVSWTERIDKVLLHPGLGFSAFLLVMLAIFQSLFWLADPAISLIETLVTKAQGLAEQQLPEGLLGDLVVQGVLGGVGNVVVFLPQILILFFLIGVLEDSGYMARVAYLMDRALRGVGLQGKAFVPMLGGLACAVPAILATRTMERRRDRLLTMMVVPLMSCSARLPVYALLVGALFPPTGVFGGLPVQGLLMVGMYMFSTLTTLCAAWVLGRTVIRGRHIPLLLELPRYRLPSLGNTARMMWQRAKEFVTEAGTVILAFTIVMWVLLSFPKLETPLPISGDANGPVTELQAASVRVSQAPSPIEHTYGGQIGHALAPVMAPLGFDWKLTVGIIGAFSAREVFVSTLGLVFGIEDAEAEEAKPLRDRMRAETRPDGSPAYPPLVAFSLMIFFALACQCMSTLAVVHRETRSWRWPALLFVYMTTLAYLASLTVFQVGRWLGFAG